MQRTKSGLPKHCGWNLDRKNGTKRVRFRKDGFSTYLSGTPWGTDFMGQYAAALDRAKPQAGSIGSDRILPGSFDAVAIAYYRSPEFHALADGTQTGRRRIIERLRGLFGKLPVSRLERKNIKDLMAINADKPMAANNLLNALRTVLNCAVDLEMVSTNVAIGIKKYKQKGDGFHCWNNAEVEQFRAAYPIGSKPRLALELLLGTGQRRSDVVRFGWQHVEHDVIVLRQKKTGKTLRIPILPELAEALASVPRGTLTFLLDDRGRSFDAHAFGNWFSRRCGEAGLKGCAAHGLRKTAATRLANLVLRRK